MVESRSVRSIAAMAALAVSVVVWGGRAQAQATGTGGSSGAAQPFVAEDFFVALNGPDGNRLTTADGSRFFNLARCNCQTPVGIFVALLQSGLDKRAAVTASTGTVSIVLGPGCKTTDAVVQGTQLETCRTLGTESILTFLDQQHLTFETDAQQFSVPLMPTVDGGVPGTCVAPNGQSFTQTINVNFDFDGDGGIDLSVPDQAIVDLAPPPAPTSVTVQPGSEALVVGWTAVPGAVTDLLGYQVLCSRADQYQVFKETATDGGATGPFTAAFVTCPSAMSGTGVEGNDPTFVCSPVLAADATSARIEVLQNGITYAAAVVAVDTSGNASESTVEFGVPTQTLSFYATYRNGEPPGGAAGGLCSVGPSGPSPKRALGGLTLFVTVAAGLFGRRRRRRGCAGRDQKYTSR